MHTPPLRDLWADFLHAERAARDSVRITGTRTSASASENLANTVWRLDDGFGQEHTQLLREAILGGDQRLVLLYLKFARPDERSVMVRSLTVALADLLTDIAITPGGDAPDARDLLVEALAAPEVQQQILQSSRIALSAADREADYETYALVGRMLDAIGGEPFELFLDRLDAHGSKAIRELAELFR